MAHHIKLSILTLLLITSVAQAAVEDANRGETLFKQCAGCHGNDGKNKAFGKSGIIAGQNAQVLIESLKYYKETDFKAHGTSLVMSKQVKNMNIQDLTDIANYISKLK